MASTLHIKGSFDAPLVLPMEIQSFEDFRKWTQTSDFPTGGRIDYIDGRIDVDMSPERFIAHGKLKLALIRAISNRVELDDLGHLVADRTRVVHPETQLSVEPDLAFVSYDAVESGRVRLTESAGDPHDYIELVGGPDLAAEIVSDSSLLKDTRDLVAAYFAAGVQEYWLADARNNRLDLILYRRGPAGFESTPADADGFLESALLGHRYRLTQTKDRSGMRKFVVEERQ